jgi:DNA-binding FadR family transcriptional regulator
LILNDFASIFTAMARHYFSKNKARRASLSYYRELSETIKRSNRQDVERVVKKAMLQSITIWQEQ